MPMDRPRGGSTIRLETPEVLFVADDAACSPGTEPGNNMTQERLTRRIKQLEAENLFDNSTGEEKSGAEGASSGIDGTSPVVDEAFARVWRGEIGKEFCGMADARRKNTMSTVRSDEMAWAEEQARHSPKVPH